MESLQPLNLTRRLRPKNFDEIVGQTFSIKMLQNGLYLNKFFPVYLFAGQRGCGKTTTARVFAAAINCEQLPQFQADPTKHSVPCLACPSCMAMQTGQHPDFIEIDAASHTGVDNVRQILESCSYMPLIGRKKIYLIDEAHMLSKAAFNAFLKVLEEPPMTALFILATTESNKIPVTVKSRCFQAYFKALPHDDLKAYLTQVCVNEGITISDEALDIILQETEGSARDALNLLEQVRSMDKNIDESSMHKALGIINKKDFFAVFNSILSQEPGQLLRTLESINFTTTTPQIIWNMLLELIRSLIRIKYRAPLAHSIFSSDEAILNHMSSECTINRLHAMLQLLWSQEELFLKTHQKHLLLEHIMLQLCEQVNFGDLKELLARAPATSPTAQPARPASAESRQTTARLQQPPQQPMAQPQPVARTTQVPAASTPTELPRAAVNNAPFVPLTVVNNPVAPVDSRWLSFTEQVATLGDHMLGSIFKQAVNKGISDDGKIIKLQLNNSSQFFKDKVAETKPQWLPFLHAAYEGVENFQIENNPNPVIKKVLSSQMIPSSPSGGGLTVRNQLGIGNNGGSRAPNPNGVDISDSSQWPQANLLIQHFPGTLEKVKDRK